MYVDGNAEWNEDGGRGGISIKRIHYVHVFLSMAFLDTITTTHMWTIEIEIVVRV